MLQETATVSIPTSAVTTVFSIAGGCILAGGSFIVHLLIRILSKVNDLATHNTVMEYKMSVFDSRVKALETRRGTDYYPHHTDTVTRSHSEEG